MKCRRYIFWMTLSLIYLALVSYLCFANIQNGPQMNRMILGIPADKIVHFLMFLPSPILFFNAFMKRFSALTLSLVCALCTLLAVSTELIQSTIPYRTMELGDLLADILGVVAGASLLLITKKDRP